MVSRGQSLKPQQIKTKPLITRRRRLPAIPFIFSDGMRGLVRDRFFLKSGRKRKVKPDYEVSKQSFERFVLFDF